MTDQQPTLRLRKGYIKEFDGLRGLAAVAVVAGHAAPVGHWVRDTNCAFLAVRFFFVLSGFLITGILMDQVAKSPSLWRSMTAFYVRRALRIFPPYYLFLLVFLAAGNDFVYRSIGWSLTYTTNLYFAYFGNARAPISHFWTLAVEEQFYLVWPVILLFLFGKHWRALIVFACLIVSAVVFRELAAGFSASRPQILYPPIASLDSLLMGAAAAYFARCEHPTGEKIVRLLHLGGLFIFLPLLVILKVTEVWSGNPVINDVTYGQLLIAFASVGIVLQFSLEDHATLKDRIPMIGRLLNQPMLSYLGTISYGIYIYHFPFDRMFYERVLVKSYGFPDDFWLHFFVVMTLTIVTASLSWHLVEKRLLQYKAKFPY